jgi:cytochrome c-type biogenesis protein CcmH
VNGWRLAAVAALVVLLVAFAARTDGEMRAAAVPLGDGPDAVQRIQAHLAHTPRDGRAWVTLARLEFQAERYEAAARAFERGIAVSRRIAQDPQVWCELADALGMAQGGSLRGKPREAVDRALSLKGNHPRALEMAGSAAIETGDDERALSYWEPLLVQLDPRSKEYRELRAAIDRIGQRAALGRFGAAPRS